MEQFFCGFVLFHRTHFSQHPSARRLNPNLELPAKWGAGGSGGGGCCCFLIFPLKFSFQNVNSGANLYMIPPKNAAAAG